jgi:Na+-translocating ferredoxin:NAD+ oxidoreductase RnfA subunit
MKKNKKIPVMAGILGLPSAIITVLIFDLILERDLLEGLIYSIPIGLVFFITWMVMATIRNRKKERKKIKFLLLMI